MSTRTFYRLSVWLPLAVPAALALLVNGLGVGFAGSWFEEVVQVMLISLVYGGIPYGLLAIWATWRIGQRSEAEIRRDALRAPLWMIAVWIPLAMVPGIIAREIEMFAGLVALGAVYAIVLGYSYVGVVLGLRALLVRAGLITTW